MKKVKQSQTVVCGECNKDYTVKAIGYYGMSKILKDKGYTRVKTGKTVKWVCSDCHKASRKNK